MDGTPICSIWKLKTGKRGKPPKVIAKPDADIEDLADQMGVGPHMLSLEGHVRVLPPQTIEVPDTAKIIEAMEAARCPDGSIDWQAAREAHGFTPQRFYMPIAEALPSSSPHASSPRIMTEADFMRGALFDQPGDDE